mmetsp:Transcript_31440/g.76022  ORF Transcript_31440/g.76022 Transcript_31440/m.76022 type:complete len:80 (+) Transcript_31440:431-670(+)
MVHYFCRAVRRCLWMEIMILRAPPPFAFGDYGRLSSVESCVRNAIGSDFSRIASISNSRDFTIRPYQSIHQVAYELMKN